MASERLQKVLARAGYGSRRALEVAIEEGRISVNGVIAVLGTKIEKDDEIAFNGKPVPTKKLFGQTRLVLAYHKPAGEVCTRKDPEGRPTIFDRLPKLSQGRWIAVGRLDINTSGLILLTTDGELSNRLMHPSSGVDREYMVRVHGNVTNEQLARLVEGVILEDGPARFTDIVQHPESDRDRLNHWFYVTLMEGRNREVRRLWESQGLRVNRLKRVRYGCIFLPSFLRRGHFVELGQKEVDDLSKLVGLPSLKVPRMTLQELKDIKRRLSKKSLSRKSTIASRKSAKFLKRPSGHGR
ncbi:MAG TPA: 23S rRNA pseudouridylate synthase B [Gammaproteobacteria bacterium]|nr:23S rRNA pseudouridylate synthase B [Gammaproteobacteria bacterium]HBX26060.1 23S rRNA pseudouridylate synthase B [Gammaproteobacteria bacterium]